jgi:fatty acid desaturase
MPTLEISGLRGHDAKDETKKLISKLRSDRKAWVGALAIVTIVLFYTSGVIIASQPLPWAFFGVPMMAESMILSWYLGHECAHSLVFRNRRLNNLLGADIDSDKRLFLSDGYGTSAQSVARKYTN